MNKDAQIILNNILKKDLHELTPSDITFLKARQSYLSSTQLLRFSTVLEQEMDPPEIIADVNEPILKVEEKKQVVKVKPDVASMKYKELYALAKQIGYVHKGKGVPPRDDLEVYVVQNQ